ncbi:MAG: glutathione S-transferase family protein [Thioalkalispiraceae bacterium]|jgi:putative glutathione S-transferase
MSLLVNGQMQSNWFEKETRDGKFDRMESTFRNWITPDGAPGISGEGGFKAEPGRYHLYVSYACPWAHRTLIVRKLKKLEELISVSVVDPRMGDKGWSFAAFPGATEDSVNAATYLYENYVKAQADFTGIVTVPVLWDKQRQTIVNNESSEIIRMLNNAFNQWADDRVDLYPLALRGEIDRVNEFVYDRINNGVYKCGFATEQQAYDEAYQSLFSALDEMEARLTRQRYLAGELITEADWRLFVTLLRFDAVYYSLFKCNRQRIDDYPALSNYLRELYQWPGIQETNNMQHIKTHYYYSLTQLNPSRIIPRGPLLDYSRSHNRAQLSGE